MRYTLFALLVFPLCLCAQPARIKPPTKPTPAPASTAPAKPTIGKTRRLTNTAATDKAQAEAAQANSVISTMQRVDLGLSVCWAGYNLGATSPEQCGGYYAWGETEAKEDFSYYKYAKGSSITGYTKYTNIGTNISGTKYDAARATWGGDWRLPTEDEAKELIERCYWASITYNGMKGRKVTGPNGNAIFIPCAGYYHNYVNRDDDNSGYYKWEKIKDSGYYMTGSTYNATSGSCVSLDMYRTTSPYDIDTHQYVTSQYDRECGRSVRAVCK